MKKRKRQKKYFAGFGLVELIVIAAIIAAAGIGGGLYFKESKNQQNLIQLGKQKEKEAEALKEKILQRQREQLESIGESSSPSPTPKPAPKPNSALPPPIIGPSGGTITTPEGVQLTLPPKTIPASLRFTTVLSQSRVARRSLPTQIPILAAVTITAEAVGSASQADFPAFHGTIYLPLNIPQPPGKQLLVLSPSEFLDSWEDTGETATVSLDGGHATFPISDLTTFILIRPEDMGAQGL